MSNWQISKHDSVELISEWTLPGHLSEKEIKTVLERLTCQHLNAEEIIGASKRRSDKEHNTLLEVRGSGRSLSCGENPHYIAKLID